MLSYIYHQLDIFKVINFSNDTTITLQYTSKIKLTNHSRSQQYNYHITVDLNDTTITSQ